MRCPRSRLQRRYARSLRPRLPLGYRVLTAKRHMKRVLRVIPLGGLGAIGRNMTVFEYGDAMVVVDAGLMFPDESMPGIDLVLPDFSYVLEHGRNVRGVILTHGHEDHVGALPYLLK